MTLIIIPCLSNEVEKEKSVYFCCCLKSERAVPPNICTLILVTT